MYFYSRPWKIVFLIFHAVQINKFYTICARICPDALKFVVLKLCPTFDFNGSFVDIDSDSELLDSRLMEV